MTYYIKALRICRRAGQKGVHTRAMLVCRDIDIAKRDAEDLRKEHAICTVEITDESGKVWATFSPLEGGAK